jgi:hypothetical protein
MKENSTIWRIRLNEDLHRLRELQTKKDAACSSFDLSMGYDWKFNSKLKRNHVLYAINKIRELQKDEQLSLL